MTEIIAFDTPETTAAFSVDAEKRTIRGLAVPYGATASSRGRTWSFTKGSLTFSEVSRVKLIVQHDMSAAVGKAIALEDTDAGLLATFKVARTPAGDNALVMAEDGVWDGLSVGIGDGGTFEERDGIFHAVSMPLTEVSLTPSPAFSDARVMQVTAEKEGSNMPDDDKPEGTPAPDFSALADAIKAGFESITIPATREVIPAGRTTFQVTEEPVYAFDGGKGKYEFSTDLFSSIKGDREAQSRVEEFMQAQFALAASDVTTLMPTYNRPDLYVDQREFEYPIWKSVEKGSLADGTPFTFPKFSSSGTLVANHTTLVEPTAGDFSATNATVTPVPVSGKVSIPREVVDAGGNPQVSGLIWRQMQRAWSEALEAYIVTVLEAASITSLTITTAAADGALDTAVTAALVPLQFIRGGFRFDHLALQVDLYKALAAAKDGNGRHLFPMLGPVNSNGSAQPLWSSLNVGGLRGYPAWALAATGVVSANSYLYDPGAIYAWATPPRRLDFEYQVKSIDMGLWGYKAAVVADTSGVRRLAYDPV